MNLSVSFYKLKLKSYFLFKKLIELDLSFFKDDKETPILSGMAEYMLDCFLIPIFLKFIS